MTRLAIFILSLFLSSNLFSQALEELEKQIAANNNILSKVRTDYKYASGKFAEKGVKTSNTTYDKSGNKIKVEYFDAKGNVTGSETYAYDENDNRVLFERSGTSPYKKVSKFNTENKIELEAGFNGAEEFRVEYKYNNFGKLNEVLYKSGQAIQQKLSYVHTGNIAMVNIYAQGKTLSSKLKMIYDIHGNTLEESTYTKEGKELEKKRFTYNNNSQILEETKTEDGKFYYKLTYDYDTEGRLLTISEETLAKKKFVKKKYTYDSSGNLSSYEWRRNGDQEFNIKTYTYNANGVCLSEETLYPASKFKVLAKFEYNYH